MSEVLLSRGLAFEVDLISDAFDTEPWIKFHVRARTRWITLQCELDYNPVVTVFSSGVYVEDTTEFFRCVRFFVVENNFAGAGGHTPIMRVNLGGKVVYCPDDHSIVD